jgi:hypothetical protein
MDPAADMKNQEHVHINGPSGSGSWNRGGPTTVGLSNPAPRGERELTITRPYVYVFYMSGDQSVHMSGVTLHEFLRAVNARRIGLLTDDVDDIRMMSLDGTAEDLPVNAYGNILCFDLKRSAQESDIDLRTRKSLRNMLKRGAPEESPFLEGLGNRFLCWTHDDGWYMVLHLRDPYRLGKLITRLLVSKLEHLADRVLPPIDPALARQFGYLARKGVYFDLSEVTPDAPGLVFEYRIVSPPTADQAMPTAIDMDGILNTLDTEPATGYRGMFRYVSTEKN